METVNGIFMLVCLLTLSGSMISSFFLASQTLIYDFTSADFTAKLNKFVMLSFIIPYFLPWSIYDRSVEFLLEYDVLVILEKGTLKNAAYTLREAVHFAEAVQILWLCGMAAYLLFHAAVYTAFLRKVRENSRDIGNGAWRAEFDMLCGEKKVKPGKIKLLSTTAAEKICTVGMVRHAVLIPEYLLERLDAHEINIVLRHELTHIEKHDVAAKMAALVLCGIFWFNPLAHATKKTLFGWLELRCDETVLKTADASSRRAYSNTLLKMMKEQQGQKRRKGQTAAACFSREQSADFVRKRMEGVFQNKSGTAKTAKTIILTGAVCMVAYANSFAKDMDYAMFSVFSNHLGFFDKDEFYTDDEIKDYDIFEFIPFGQETFTENAMPGAGEAAECSIVYPDGTVGSFPVQDTDALPHEHIFREANLKQHLKNSDGSCETLTYAGKICEICGKTLTGSECIQEGITFKCTHG